MRVLDLMKQRCSVRRFRYEPVEREKLDYVLEAARVAPSACNIQPWHFIVVQDQSLKDQLAPEWAAAAPVLIIACGDHRQAWRRADGKDHCDIDVAIAVDHMTLAAAEVGLGTCWICSFDAYRCARLFELPMGVEPMVLLPLGYPEETSDPNRHEEQRKPIAEIVSWDGFPAD